MFRKMLYDMGRYLEIEEGIVLNENEILLHLLWADNLILMSDSSKGLQRLLGCVFQF